MRVAGIIPVNNVAERGLRGSPSAESRGCLPAPSAGPSAPPSWLADVLRCIADTPQTQLADLLPWNWRRWSAKFAA
jgi:hypothetical protein